MRPIWHTRSQACFTREKSVNSKATELRKKGERWCSVYLQARFLVRYNQPFNRLALHFVFPSLSQQQFYDPTWTHAAFTSDTGTGIIPPLPHRTEGAGGRGRFRRHHAARDINIGPYRAITQDQSHFPSTGIIDSASARGVEGIDEAYDPISALILFIESSHYYFHSGVCVSCTATSLRGSNCPGMWHVAAIALECGSTLSGIPLGACLVV